MIPIFPAMTDIFFVEARQPIRNISLLIHDVMVYVYFRYLMPEAIIMISCFCMIYWLFV